MGINERKERQRAELRSRILDAAQELFVREGYENVSMRKIAARVEYSATTLYRLFANKAEIMDQLLADAYVRVYEGYQEDLAAGGGDPRRALRRIIEGYVRFSLDNPDHYRLWFATGELAMVRGRLRMSHGSFRHEVYTVWLEQIEACRERGMFPGRDTMTAFLLILTSVHGLIQFRIRHPDFPWPPLAEHVDDLMGVLDAGLVRGDASASGREGAEP